MKVKTIRCHYLRSGTNVMYDDLGLAETINSIGYENILQILPCYAGEGEYFYTIIYKSN